MYYISSITLFDLIFQAEVTAYWSISLCVNLCKDKQHHEKQLPHNAETASAHTSLSELDFSWSLYL